MDTEDLMQAARQRRDESLVVTPRIRWGWILAAVALGVGWGWFNVGDSPGYAGFFLVGAAYGVLLTAFEVVHARRRPGLVLTTAPSGAPATAALRSVVPQRLEGVLGCYLLVAAVLVVSRTIEVGGRGSALFLAVSVVLVVLMGVVLVPIVAGVTGRRRAGGLYLTQQGVEHADRHFRWALSWDEVAGALAAAHLQIVLVGRDDVDLRRISPWAWRRRSTTPGVVQVHGPALAVDPRDLAALIDDLVARPAARSALGTPASVDRPPVRAEQ